MTPWLRRQPKLSLVVIVYNMAREAPRTLYSLSCDYQRGIDADDYEIIVVDNGSDQPLDAALFKTLRGQFFYHRREPGEASPARAINQGVAEARGELIGVSIDGARLCSPGLLSWALRAAEALAQPVVATLNWHLGPKPQNVSIAEGYDQTVEDRLLESIRWPADGYALHSISALGGSSRRGYFCPLSESNVIFMRRALFTRLRGYDPAFTSPGGGLVNLDFYKRACEHPDSELVVLLGEGSFHQLHGGIITNAGERKQARRARFDAEYRQLRGSDFRPPQREAVFMGSLPPAALGTLAWSVEQAQAYHATARADTDAGRP